MEDNLQVLREIGAHKIHSETHISKEYVQALIHGSFEDLQSLQFFGFVSILEKTYGLDLTELREKGKAHFAEEATKTNDDKKVFVVAKKEEDNTKIYLFIGIAVFLSFIYYSFTYVNSMEDEVVVVDNTKIENAQKNLEMTQNNEPTLVIDKNQNNDTIVVEDKNVNEEVIKVEKKVDENLSETAVKKVELKKVKEKEPEEIKAVEVVRSLKILPKRKIWAGYIDIETNKKYQNVFKKEHALDTTKDWLLLFGRGTAKLEVNGEVQKFSSKQNMRFKYVGGKFKKITVSEFKLLNKGRKW